MAESREAGAYSYESFSVCGLLHSFDRDSTTGEMAFALERHSVHNWSEIISGTVFSHQEQQHSTVCTVSLGTTSETEIAFTLRTQSENIWRNIILPKFDDDDDEELEEDTVYSMFHEFPFETVESSYDTEDTWSDISPENYLQHDEQPQDDTTYTMYHGTTLKAAFKIIKKGFKRSPHACMLGEGVYVSRDIEKAERYPLGNKKDQVIFMLNVNVGKVIMIDYQKHPLQKTWHEAGYDTAWVPENCGMVPSGLEEDCIWDPERIELVRVEKAPLGFKAILNKLIKWSKK